MEQKPQSVHKFTEQDILDLNVELKIGVLGTVTPEGLPHLTLLSTLQPYSENTVVWGQFTEGNSKKYILENPNTGFLVMSLQKEIWRGKTSFREKRKNGKEFDQYNNMKMFRYNAYFGIHTVYYMDVVELHGRQALPMASVVISAIKTMIARMLGKKDREAKALNTWGQVLLNKLDNLKFLGYIDSDGFPQILPVVQLQALDAGHLIFSPGAFGEEINMIPKGAQVAMLGMSLDMEDVLTRGTYQGIQRIGGVRCGVLEVDWVYNPMPPVAGQVFPRLDLKSIPL